MSKKKIIDAMVIAERNSVRKLNDKIKLLLENGYTLRGKLHVIEIDCSNSSENITEYVQMMVKYEGSEKDPSSVSTMSA